MSHRPPNPPNPNNPDGRFPEYRELCESEDDDLPPEVGTCLPRPVHRWFVYSRITHILSVIVALPADALEALYAACRSDDPNDLFAIHFGRYDNGSVLVAVETPEQVERLKDMTNGRVRATVLCKYCGRVPCHRYVSCTKFDVESIGGV